MDRPNVVCICGSTKFGDLWRQAILRETLAGSIVLAVGCFTQSDDEMPEITRLVKARLDVLHFHKIDMADEILVLNQDGYVGESTEREIEYATSRGKRVRWYFPGMKNRPAVYHRPPYI